MGQHWFCCLNSGFWRILTDILLGSNVTLVRIKVMPSFINRQKPKHPLGVPYCFLLLRLQEVFYSSVYVKPQQNLHELQTGS